MWQGLGMFFDNFFILFVAQGGIEKRVDNDFFMESTMRLEGL